MSGIALENQREVRSIVTRNQNGTLVNAKDIAQKFTDVFECEIGPIVTALVKEGNEKELKSLENAIVRDGGKLVLEAKTYEMAMSDTSVFKSVRWGAIIVDEGHRLKNQNSRLTRTLLSFNCPWRCLLTGTPLQNNLVRIGVFPNPNSIVFPKSRHTVCRLSRVITHTRGPKD